MGTKETSSGLKGEGDSALTHGALDKDCDAEMFWASIVAVSAACWAADLRSR